MPYRLAIPQYVAHLTALEETVRHFPSFRAVRKEKHNERSRYRVEATLGIEPRTNGYKALVLPLNYAAINYFCKFRNIFGFPLDISVNPDYNASVPSNTPLTTEETK